MVLTIYSNNKLLILKIIVEIDLIVYLVNLISKLN